MTPTAPSSTDEARAHTLVETYRRQWPDLAGYGLLEAAETLSAALQAERTKAEERKQAFIDAFNSPGMNKQALLIDPDPCPPHGLPRPGWFARRFTVVHVAACTVAGGAVYVGLGWIIWTAL